MKSIHLLLVEDNEGDILLTQEAFEESKFVHTMQVAKNGNEALNILLQREGYENSKEPDLVLLDINLPIKSGHEVLQEIKSVKSKRHIPIVVFSTSSSQKDIDLAYLYNANCYVTKPVEIKGFMEAISSIEQFWFSIASLPKKVK
ncbi:response regulator [Marivirga salinae]|uniref:Response regulator n=1 Tax=Marivirga salinarum TaxID=3059078 RepID=A0AA51NE23_9BACT|nr:response regulator [Marivirga sp. BDSF4-3]WMN12221.1 response regulator [Marivirga sp. BDSF4-3]